MLVPANLAAQHMTLPATEPLYTLLMQDEAEDAQTQRAYSAAVLALCTALEPASLLSVECWLQKKYRQLPGVQQLSRAEALGAFAARAVQLLLTLLANPAHSLGGCGAGVSAWASVVGMYPDRVRARASAAQQDLREAASARAAAEAELHGLEHQLARLTDAKELAKKISEHARVAHSLSKALLGGAQAVLKAAELATEGAGREGMEAAALAAEAQRLRGETAEALAVRRLVHGVVARLLSSVGDSAVAEEVAGGAAEEANWPTGELASAVSGKAGRLVVAAEQCASLLGRRETWQPGELMTGAAHASAVLQRAVTAALATQHAAQATAGAAAAVTAGSSLEAQLARAWEQLRAAQKAWALLRGQEETASADARRTAVDSLIADLESSHGFAAAASACAPARLEAAQYVYDLSAAVSTAADEAVKAHRTASEACLQLVAALQAQLRAVQTAREIALDALPQLQGAEAARRGEANAAEAAERATKALPAWLRRLFAGWATLADEAEPVGWLVALDGAAGAASDPLLALHCGGGGGGTGGGPGRLGSLRAARWLDVRRGGPGQHSFKLRL